MARTRPFDRDRYLDRVVELLADEFGWDSTTRDVCRAHLGKFTDGFDPSLEFICDSPVSATWRLKAHLDARPWGLRMAYYGRSPHRREIELTRRLEEVHAASR